MRTRPLISMLSILAFVFSIVVVPVTIDLSEFSVSDNAAWAKKDKKEKKEKKEKEDKEEGKSDEDHGEAKGVGKAKGKGGEKGKGKKRGYSN